MWVKGNAKSNDISAIKSRHFSNEIYSCLPRKILILILFLLGDVTEKNQIVWIDYSEGLNQTICSWQVDQY